jgi:hypothetical protein
MPPAMLGTPLPLVPLSLSIISSGKMVHTGHCKLQYVADCKYYSGQQEANVLSSEKEQRPFIFTDIVAGNIWQLFSICNLLLLNLK